MQAYIALVSLSLIVGAAIAGPVAEPVQVEDVEAGTRDETGSLSNFVAQLRDSLVVPLLLNPFEVNKLTCGSIITFYDNSADADATVAVDLCLTALLLAKLFVIVPMILSNMDAGSLEGGVFGIFDKLGESLSRLDLAGSGPEGESFEANLANAANKYAEETPEFKESPATYDDDEGYVGFGFNGWQSGVQSFPDISQVNEFTTNYLPRSFPVGKLEKLLTSSLHELEHAISVEKKN